MNTTPKLSVVIPTRRGGRSTIRANCAALIAAFCGDLEAVIVPASAEASNKDFAGLDELQQWRLKVLPAAQRTAGKARNDGIAHASGDYVYFLDDDDLIDAHALHEALELASRNDWDVACFPYTTTGTASGSGQGPMRASDQVTWEMIKRHNEERALRSQLALLGNYPWIRLTKRTLIESAKLRFGRSAVHNDIVFHWHSLACATRVGIFLKPVCSHTTHPSGQQLTTVDGPERLQLFDELVATNICLRAGKLFSELLPSWEAFCKELAGWAREQIANEHLEAFDARERKFWAEMCAEDSSPQLPLLERLAHEAQLSRQHRYDYLHRRTVDAFIEAYSEDGETAQKRIKSRILSNINLDALRPRQKKQLLDYYRLRLSRQSKASTF